MQFARCLLWVPLALVSFAATALADVKLPAIFNDYMVLQRDQPVPVWGWADPSEEVTVSFRDQSKTTTAGADGKWSLKLDPVKASEAAQAMTVAAGTESVKVEDVLVGDVWVDMIVDSPVPRLQIGVCRFAPWSRTAWHHHALGQTLHVTEGIGLVQARGGDVIVMHPGDTVYTPPGEWHWHGAADNHFMTHLAISETTDDPAAPHVEWGEHLTQAEQHAARAATADSNRGTP